VKTTRLRIVMREVRPRVLRVLDVPAACTLPELHDLLQVGLGWTDSHLHLFVTDQGQYGVPSDDWDDGVVAEDDVLLRALPSRFTYLYDFGDGWEHDVEVLGAGGPEPGCVFGEGACPPEDCGGTSGYEELLEVLADPTHEDHEHLSGWAGHWEQGRTGFDQEVTDRLVRNTVGQVPQSVRLVLDLLADGVRLTPGGRLPRAVVRAVQHVRPGWSFWDKPASLEDDLMPLSTLHDTLRDVGLARLHRGVLSPTRAAADDVQVVRRLRRAMRAGSFAELLGGTAVALVSLRGPQSVDDLAAAVHPHLGRGWSVGGRPVTPADVGSSLNSVGSLLQGLDLIESDWSTWRPGPSALTLLPRTTALAHLWAALPGDPGPG
jgi:hypothetical protein